MNLVTLVRTVEASEKPPKAIWMKHIAKKEIDLSKVDGNTILGYCIIEAYPKNPEKTLQEIIEQAIDHRELVESVIGPENAKLIL